MKRYAGVLILVLVLAGCSSAPARDAVVERFELELEGTVEGDAGGAFSEVAGVLADAALDGRCGDEAYRSSLVDESLTFAWDMGCLMLFESELSAEQVDRAKRDLAERAVERAG